MIKINFVLIFLLGISLLPAQVNRPMPNVKERPQLQIQLLTAPPTVDGEVFNDAAWQSIAPITELWQTKPNAGNLGTEKTEIRVGYDEANLYVSAICYDQTPDQLVVTDSRRDALLDNTDAFLFILDTYHDGQNGFVFGTNPVGVEYDGQVDNEGIGNINANRQQGGRIGGFNLNWDAAWKVKSKVDKFGWSTEFAIPLRTLRYNPGDNQVWGANFQRNIRKNNEVNYWAALPVEFNLHRLSLAGTISGMNLKNPGNLKIIPYVLGNVRRIGDSDQPWKGKGEVGGDVKYSITPSLTLDLTYNTDFAQVEVDEQQVNLDRFNLFFPEKRPFFLENAGWFGVGSPGEIELFFSRRIGIDNSGNIVPIIGGARLTGKVNRTNIGMLSMFTDDVSSTGISKNNFSVARVSHEFAQRSSFGAAFINREGLGEGINSFNRTLAADTRIGLGKKAQISAFYAQTYSPDNPDNHHAFKLQSNYEWNRWNFNLAYSEVGEGFNPEVGFLLRNSFRKPEALALYHWRMNGKFGLLELRPHVSWRSYWDFNGFLQTSFLHVDNHWEWENGTEIHTGINFTTEGVLKDFPISENVTVPAGTYNHQEAQLVLMTNQSKTLSMSTRAIIGGFFGGSRIANGGSVFLRFGDRFNSEFGLQTNYIKLPDGNFTTNIFKVRLAYSFTPHIFTQALIQYNNVLHLWSSNIRLGWIKQANTGLFLVYNDARGNAAFNQRSFTVKYSYVFDVLK